MPLPASAICLLHAPASLYVHEHTCTPQLVLECKCARMHTGAHAHAQAPPPTLTHARTQASTCAHAKHAHANAHADHGQPQLQPLHLHSPTFILACPMPTTSSSLPCIHAPWANPPLSSPPDLPMHGGAYCLCSRRLMSSEEAVWMASGPVKVPLVASPLLVASVPEDASTAGKGLCTPNHHQWQEVCSMHLLLMPRLMRRQVSACGYRKGGIEQVRQGGGWEREPRTGAKGLARGREHNHILWKLECQSAALGQHEHGHVKLH